MENEKDIKTRKEQIVEMAKAMSDFELKDTAKCDIELAEHLFAKGYRKQSDTVGEFVERLFAKIRPMYFSLIGRNVGEIIDELAKEYGVECHYLVQLIEYMSGQGVEVEE